MKALIAVGEGDITWSPIILEVCKELSLKHSEIVFVNLTKFSYPRYRLPPKFILRKYNLTNSICALEQMFLDHKSRLSWYRVTKKSNRLVYLDESETRQIEKSTKSMIVSLYRDPDVIKNHPLTSRLVYIFSLKRAKQAFRISIDAIGKERPDLVVLPNGRFPHQEAVRLAAIRLKIPVLHYENGMFRKDYFYCRDTETNDRLGNQSAILSNFSEEVETSEALAWLESRTSPSGTANEFARTWANDVVLDAHNSKFSCVLFSSSQDETIALPNWDNYGWEDQYEAFDSFLKNLQGSFVIRIHPNFLNKSYKAAISESRRIDLFSSRNPNLLVILPSDPVDSYKLLELADRVLVFGSTIGIEAVCRGKNVWCAGNSIYDQILDIRIYKPQHEYESQYFEPWRVDAEKGLIGLANLMGLEKPRTLPSAGVEWSSLNIPIAIRLFNILRSGSILYFVILIRISFSIRFNRLIILLLKRKLSKRGQHFLQGMR